MAVEFLNLKISIYKYKAFCKITMYVNEMCMNHTGQCVTCVSKKKAMINDKKHSKTK